MREFKFRAYYDGKLHKPFGLFFLDTPKLLMDIPADAVIQQYTGFKDINDKEIYEGDIVNFDPHYEGDYWNDQTVGAVEWIDGGVWVGNTGTDIDVAVYYNAEVIGNIYENNT